MYILYAYAYVYSYRYNGTDIYIYIHIRYAYTHKSSNRYTCAYIHMLYRIYINAFKDRRTHSVKMLKQRKWVPPRNLHYFEK